ncbi:MAG: CheR family methyltransferase [Nitrospirota bacterium]
MTPELSNNSLSTVSEFISSLIGLHFKESRWNDLKYGIESASREFGFSDVETFINWLQSASPDRKHIEILASHLTIGETWFFREQDTFSVLEERVLSELITSRYSNQKRLRIWSAGCSTGEEAYSIAILLNKMMADISEWNITILATDINPKFLSKASEGTYTDWSFRGTPSWVRENYFRQKGHGLHEIRPSIKKMVTFSYLNLVEDVYPSLLNNTNAIDIIFCRNVLMYFSPQIANKVIRGLNNSLIKGGWLFLSPTDAIRPLPEDLVPVRCPETTTYRKEAGRISLHEEYHGFTQESLTPQEIPEHIPAQKTENEQPGTYSKALSMFEQGQAALMARAYANQGVMDEAMRWCEKAIAGDKLNPAGYHLLAIILYEQGRIEDAVKFLKKAIYLDHNFILAYFMLGNLKLKLGDIKGSKICFKNVLGILSSHNPEDVIEGSDGMTAGRLAEIIDSMSVT